MIYALIAWAIVGSYIFSKCPAPRTWKTLILQIVIAGPIIAAAVVIGVIYKKLDEVK